MRPEREQVVVGQMQTHALKSASSFARLGLRCVDPDSLAARSHNLERTSAAKAGHSPHSNGLGRIPPMCRSEREREKEKWTEFAVLFLSCWHCS
jgi:hypothetical protein